MIPPTIVTIFDQDSDLCVIVKNNGADMAYKIPLFFADREDDHLWSEEFKTTMSTVMNRVETISKNRHVNYSFFSHDASNYPLIKITAKMLEDYHLMRTEK